MNFRSRTWFNTIFSTKYILQNLYYEYYAHLYQILDNYGFMRKMAHKKDSLLFLFSMPTSNKMRLGKNSQLIWETLLIRINVNESCKDKNDDFSGMYT